MTAIAITAAAYAPAARRVMPVAAGPMAAAAKPAAPAVELHQEIVSPMAEIIVQANASTRADNDRYDNRVTGATENVRSFDRMENITKGFEHLREIFQNLQEESARAAEASPMADGQSTMALPDGATLDMKV
ncbi:hypothetical protein AB0T83_17120 [Fluviibacterium sp. DFM31]|uniref:Uncharacterized protein n=1 Tax=Meridianimarinicoccus marinus TaxID=3231483 RepID=A0ABV3LAA8_9RHOB